MLEVPSVETVWFYLIGLVLISHGIVHFSIMRSFMEAAGNEIGWTGSSWLLSPLLSENAVRAVNNAIGLIAMAGFVMAGAGFLGVVPLEPHWRDLAIVSSIISLVLFVIVIRDLLPNPVWFLGGTAIDIAILVSLMWIWPDQVPAFQ